MEKKRNKTVRHILTLTGCLLVVLLLVPGLYLRNLLGREKEPSAMLGAMFRLATTQARVTTVGNAPNHLLGELPTPNPITEYFSARGWRPVEPIQMGAVYYFGRGARRLVVKSRAFTGLYRYYEVTEKPVTTDRKISNP